MITIQNTAKAIHILQAVPEGSNRAEKVRLEPGANEIEDSLWSQCSASEYAQGLLARGVLRVLPKVEAVEEFKPSAAPVLSLASLKVKEALKAIEACTVPEQLEVWLETDGRRAVRDALVKRHHELVDPVDTVERDKNEGPWQ